ncbi:PAS fold [Cedecea neteri]|uniref:LuxR family transcriptional regulator n=1 Tax=Cedecea neteri TaxID=158822 RepID=A0A291E6F2_9ENTR|nr:PAS domain-containing protein [Cedecea neteri]ATF95479.1 LuxR family transcriptional regulator [Cedecea neteri]SQC92087.1 PAS fold [Cedecea neteri]
MDFYFKRSLFGWAIKDNASRYIYVNDLACQYFNISATRIMGRIDTELIPDIGEHYKYILRDDNEIIKNKKMSIVLKVFNYGNEGKLRAYLVEKRPWPLQNGSTGIICTYIELTNVYLSSFFDNIYRKPLIFTRPSPLFTDREWEIILLLLCGVKRKGISEILGISYITLRNRIILCCEKSGVLNYTQLLKYIRTQGWDNYIPPFFLKQGHMILV